MAAEKRCGDFGGTTKSGSPCKRAAGHNTDHLGDGRCADHGPETTAADVRAEGIKKKVLEELRAGTPLFEAAKEAGSSEVSVWRYRQADPEFGAAVDELLDEGDSVRLRRVESSVYRRIIEGEAGQTLTIFWLVNTAARVARKSGHLVRWEHVYNVNQNVSGGLQIPLGALELAQARLAEEGDLGEDFVPELTVMDGGGA